MVGASRKTPTYFVCRTPKGTALFIPNTKWYTLKKTHL